MICFAQNAVITAGENDYSALAEYSAPAEYFSGVSGLLNYKPSFNLLNPVPMANETTQDDQSQSIFKNSPQWVKDFRRGEIVFFGTLPVTLLFTRIFVDLYRMGTHGWDQRYAPWPLQSAGAVLMNTSEIILTFSIALSVSLTLAITDHLIVRSKRKAAAALEDY
jgi:hypothetical protein